MMSMIVSTAIFAVMSMNVQAMTIREANPTDIGVFCGAIAEKVACNAHEFCSYKDDKKECAKLNSVVEALNDPKCIGYTTVADCEADVLCSQGKKTLRCKGDKQFLYLNADDTVVDTGVEQPSAGKYTHTSKYCRTFMTEAQCAAGAHFNTVCEWEKAVAAAPATATEKAIEATAARCGNKAKSNKAANLQVCNPASGPLSAEACAADMRCELGMVGSAESCKPSDQILVLV